MRSPNQDRAPDADTGGADTVTRLLENFEGGNASALDAVFPIVYDELREIAHRHRRRWKGDTTLGTTALVNEAYLRLVNAKGLRSGTRIHFLRIASRAMRQILCNYGRDRRARKRGGNGAEIRIDTMNEELDQPLLQADALDLAALADSLDRLEQFDRRLASVVECRFFGGLSIEETAEILNVSGATIKRDWTLARAWLYRDMTSDER